MSTYWKLDRNITGRDFVVGDVHGNLYQLQVQLEKLRFDPGIDRLFFLGDIVDRGPDSAKLIEMVDQHTYISILGNHEAMMIAGLEDSNASKLHCANGGSWFYELPFQKQQKIVTKARSWPWAIELTGDTAQVGLIHADIPQSNWQLVKALLENISDAWSDGASLAEAEIMAVAKLLLWQRSLAKHLYQDVLELGHKKRTMSQYKSAFLDRIGKLQNVEPPLVRPFEIKGIDRVYMGHSYVPAPTNVGNCYFLDTYRGDAGEKLTIQHINYKEKSHH
ncbi:metallophosphoesterase [Microbulbifer sp. CnH-101-E]|uniref:metallophosphoesterase n=1 Tax=unclassified Microbulbifer TaxID=2619833 RepID=UPI00403A49D3